MFDGDFKAGEWVWFVRTKYSEENFNCHACKTNISKYNEHKVVEIAQITTLTEQSFAKRESRRSFELSNPETKFWSTVVWQESHEVAPLFKTKEEAEAALALLTDKHTTKVARNDNYESNADE